MTDIFPSCPVQVGDRFYRANYCNRHKLAIPNRIEVMGIEQLKEPIEVDYGEKFDDNGNLISIPVKGYYKIHGRYMYNTIGPHLEEDFYDTIFRYPNTPWVIEKKGDKRIK